MSTQLGKRVPRSRTIYSPSDKLDRPSHFLLHFDSTDSYSIVLYSSINNITENRTTLNIRGKKTVATIIASGDIFYFSLIFKLINSTLLGTLEFCENEQRKITRTSQEAYVNNSQHNYSFLVVCYKLVYLFLIVESNYSENGDIDRFFPSQQGENLHTSSLYSQIISRGKR